MSSSFWLFWLVSIPLTLVVLFLWRASSMGVSLAEYFCLSHLWSLMLRFWPFSERNQDATGQSAGDTEDTKKS